MENNLQLVKRDDFLLQENPIIVIDGKRGSGKSLTLTFLLKLFEGVTDLTIFANYKLYNIIYKEVQFKELSNFPDWLHDGIIGIDEGQVDADAYAFFQREVQDITAFITQLRKRNLILIITTQVFMQLVKRIRNLTDYIIECEKTDVKGVVSLDVFEKGNGSPHLNSLQLDLRPYFQYYDTNQIIEKTDD